MSSARRARIERFLASSCASADRSSDAVRRGAHPAVIGRTEGGRLLLDLRAVPHRDDDALAAAVIAAAPAITAAGEGTSSG